MLTSRTCSRGTLKASTASMIAYRDGLLAQNPPSARTIFSPVDVTTVFLQKKGKAEHDAWIASATVHPKPGTKFGRSPCAWAAEVLKIIGISNAHRVATMPTWVLTASNF